MWWQTKNVQQQNERARIIQSYYVFKKNWKYHFVNEIMLYE